MVINLFAIRINNKYASFLKTGEQKIKAVLRGSFSRIRRKLYLYIFLPPKYSTE